MEYNTKPQNISSRSFSFAFILLILACLAAGCNEATEIDAARPRRGDIVESFTEPARTRLAKTHRVTMPVPGRIGRIDLEPGDPVRKGQELAAYDLLPFEKVALEARARVAELEALIAVKDDNSLELTFQSAAQAEVTAADEALKAAAAQVDAQKSHQQRAVKELGRMENLIRQKTISESKLDDARLLADTSLIALREQEFTLAALKAIQVAVGLGPGGVGQYIARKRLERTALSHQLTQAQARLDRAQHELKLAALKSPVDGIVLQRYEQGDGTLPAGQPLLLLGNLEQLEVQADVLTQDALRLSVGTKVQLETASRAEPIAGAVTRIEPSGFTKLSSLGVEQQRVRVIVGLEEKPEGLGVEYRLQARFITGSKTDATIVPRFSVLQDTSGAYFVLKIKAGRLQPQPVRLGLRSDLEMEILEGLTPTAQIVSAPDSTMTQGQKVKPRETSSE